jgi:hypothetical protein
MNTKTERNKAVLARRQALHNATVMVDMINAGQPVPPSLDITAPLARRVTVNLWHAEMLLALIAHHDRDQWQLMAREALRFLQAARETAAVQAENKTQRNKRCRGA